MEGLRDVRGTMFSRKLLVYFFVQTALTARNRPSQTECEKESKELAFICH